MSDHVVTVPDRIWEWAQRKSGKTVPAGFLRDVLYGAWADDIESASRMPVEVIAASTNGHDVEHEFHS